MKRTLKLPLVVLGLLMVGATMAREFRGPLPLMYDLWNPMRYPIEYHYELDKNDDKWCNNWHFDVAGVAYHRAATDAFQCCATGASIDNGCGTGTCTPCCATSTCCDKNTTTKVPWSTLIFGRSNFTLSQAFSGSSVGTAIPRNPFVTISTLTPRFEYSEAGAIFMAQLGTMFTCGECDYRGGLRARLPVRDFLVFDPCGASDLTGETLSDVWQTRMETIGTNSQKPNKVFAGRLDFLSALTQAYSFPYTQQPLVVYGDGTTTYTKMATNRVDDAIEPLTGHPIIEVICRPDGTIPQTDQWGYYTAVMDPTLAANGSGLSADQRGAFQFAAANNYATGLGVNSAAQAQLFVVPSIVGGSGLTQNQVVDGANQIMAAVEAAIGNLDSSVADFYVQNAISFCKGHNQGIGDLDLELYFGRNWGCNKDWWTDLTFGVRCPTGKRVCNCLTPVYFPLGNNKHTELRVGAAAGWNTCDWIKFMLHGSYSWALKHNEKVAAPFTGATVKNLGPCVNANINWGYFLGDFDVSFFTNDCCGFDLGYELYYKGCDKICLCQTTATDWANRTLQPLDASVLSRNTKQMGHKAKVGLFTIIGDCEIDGGWSTYFAGYNMPRETDFYLRMGVSF